MNAQINCPRCGSRRTLWFDYIANTVRILCSRGCDGTSFYR